MKITENCADWSVGLCKVTTWIVVMALIAVIVVNFVINHEHTANNEFYGNFYRSWPMCKFSSFVISGVEISFSFEIFIYAVRAFNVIAIKFSLQSFILGFSVSQLNYFKTAIKNIKPNIHEIFHKRTLPLIVWHNLWISLLRNLWKFINLYSTF